VALLGLLAATTAEDGPLLVVIDDAHWLDRASRDALQFVARRLGREGVGLLMTSRDGEGWDVAAARLPALQLTGLGADEARTVLGGDIADEVAEALMQRAGATRSRWASCATR
jgi:ATP/maltotriose-dependent transcriptional regulator MalT